MLAYSWHVTCPISLVEAKSFRELVNVLEPRYPPSPTFQRCCDTTHLPRSQDQGEKTYKGQLCMYYYRWMDFKGYRIIHCSDGHYMRDDWTIANAVLQARPLPIAHCRNYGDALSCVVAVAAGASPWASSHCH